MSYVALAVVPSPAHIDPTHREAASAAFGDSLIPVAGSPASKDATSLAATALLLMGIVIEDKVPSVVTGAKSQDAFLEDVIPAYPAVVSACSGRRPCL